MIAAPDEIGVSLPLIVAVAVTLATIVIHALAFIGTIHYLLRKQKLGQAARRFLRDVAIVAVATFIMLAAHLVEIAAWALVFVALGEFPALASAFYHSAVNYTSLGLDMRGQSVLSPVLALRVIHGAPTHVRSQRASCHTKAHDGAGEGDPSLSRETPLWISRLGRSGRSLGQPRVGRQIFQMDIQAPLDPSRPH